MSWAVPRDCMAKMQPQKRCREWSMSWYIELAPQPAETSKHALPARQNGRQRQEVPKAASAGGGDRDNRCRSCAELSTQRESVKNDQDFQGDMVGMPPAARKDNQNRVVNPSPAVHVCLFTEPQGMGTVHVAATMLRL